MSKLSQSPRAATFEAGWVEGGQEVTATRSAEGVVRGGVDGAGRIKHSPACGLTDAPFEDWPVNLPEGWAKQAR